MDGYAVELGFLRPLKDENLLKIESFPSKVGGKPIWLDKTDILTADQLRCTSCQGIMSFLLQIYAPDDRSELTYHRTLYIFVCRQGTCHVQGKEGQGLKVFRCQLPQRNGFYTDKATLESESQLNEEDLSQWEMDFSKGVQEVSNDRNLPCSPSSPLCHVCGIKGTMICGSCHAIHYCTQEHQKLDWQAGHKIECSMLKIESIEAPHFRKYPTILFPEYEIIIESEEILHNKVHNDKEDSLASSNSEEQASDDEQTDSSKKETQRLHDYETIMKRLNLSREESQAPEEGVTEHDERSLMEDKYFYRFRSVMASNPDQILRYTRFIDDDDEVHTLDPLLPTYPTPSFQLSITPTELQCSHCHEPRHLEFQVLPQLLQYLQLNENPTETTLDWTTLLIYTCLNQCIHPKNAAYSSEIIRQQLFLPLIRSTEQLAPTLNES